MDSAEDVFRKRQRVEQESEAVDKNYEIFIGANDDMNRACQVLSPAFLVWLDGPLARGVRVRALAGCLVCNVKGHKKTSAELDAALRGIGRRRPPARRGGRRGDRHRRPLTSRAPCPASEYIFTHARGLADPSAGQDRARRTSR